ncbi:MAG: thiamine pyrophosphate-binding protein [Pseudomonadota bacterium]|nr:thiamine pyrophosphate-binding protein [Pseudomonadota bacterium]MEC8463363.1 thiamine pyrophosphate-binding protein [Pseudomonadota bacterium]
MVTKNKKPVSKWSAQVFKTLKDADIAQVSYVPDAGHADLISTCLADDHLKTTRLTTEEEGVALALGAWLGGERSVLLMQSSGVGNCINMLSVIQETRSPLLMLVTMRGEWGEFNPWQIPMGQGTAKALEDAGVIVYHVDEAGDLTETVYAASQIAFNAYRPAAVLIGQRVVGFKDWRKK